MADGGERRAPSADVQARFGRSFQAHGLEAFATRRVITPELCI